MTAGSGNRDLISTHIFTLPGNFYGAGQGQFWDR